MTDANRFGGSDKYYSSSLKQREQEKETLFGVTDAQIRKLLEQHDSELQQKVERTFKQWNLIIRDYLRSDTALRLTVGDELQAVPVRVLAGLPGPIRSLLQGIPTELLNLYLRRDLFLTTHQGVRLTADGSVPLAAVLKITPKATGSEIENTRLFLEQIIEALNKFELEKRIGQINQDILGAYFFRIPHIELYWMVIGLVARIIGVSAEALTVVVTAHELAHAYTHLGKDIDRQHWDTEKFGQADLHIVEGLAQFYTGVVCEKLAPRFPDALRAYEAMLKIQPPPYTIHQKWVDQPEDAGEVIRAAMIQCRSKGITEYADFEALVDRHLDAIKGKKRKPPAPAKQ